MFFIRSDRESKEMKSPSLSTIGNFPFFELRRTFFASASVVPAGAMMRSVDMTVVTESWGFSWN